MKTATYLSLLLIITVLFCCKKVGDVRTTPETPVDTTGKIDSTGNVDTTGQTIPLSGTLTPINISCSIQGQVFNENGLPFYGVSISAGGKTVTTDKYGIFRFENISINQNGGLIKAEKEGYFNGFRNLFYKEAATNYVRIQMIPKNLVGTINATNGGSIILKNTSILLPPNSVVLATNNQFYTGTINVYAEYLDPGDKKVLQQMPGNLFSIPQDNTVAALENYGILVVELETTSREKLQLARGVEATLQMPAPTDGPSNVSFYSFDDAAGFWKEESRAVKKGDVYVGKVKHFSFWSPNTPFPSVDFEATFVDASGNPLVNELVVITRSLFNNFEGAYAITDSSGRVFGKVPKGENLTLNIDNDCGNSVFSQNIGPFYSNVNLGVVPLGANMPLITITGKVVDCFSKPVTKGYGVVVVDGKVYRAPITANGSFSMQLLNCSNANLASITGLDLVNLKESKPRIITFNSSSVDAGTLYACSSAGEESYFSYTLDGVDYTYTTPPAGYVRGSFYSSQTEQSTYIKGSNDYAWYPNGGDFTIFGESKPGSYRLFSFNHDFNRNHINLQPTGTMVTISEYGKVNEFIAGSFSDTLIETSSGIQIPHMVNCVFRVKRTK